MDVRIECQPSYAMAYLSLDVGESALVEHGAMAAMSAGISVGVGIGPGGIAKAVLRKTLGGESFFMGRYTADLHGAWVAVSPKFPGDITLVHVTPGHSYAFEAGAFLAASEGVDVDVKYAGVRTVLLREGATMLGVRGTGKALICSYGGIQSFDLPDGATMIVDTGHLVGFAETVTVKIGPLSSLTTAMATGEGLVAELTGPGEVFIQTRAEQQLQTWLLPDKQQNSRR